MAFSAMGSACMTDPAYHQSPFIDLVEKAVILGSFVATISCAGKVLSHLLLGSSERPGTLSGVSIPWCHCGDSSITQPAPACPQVHPSPQRLTGHGRTTLPGEVTQEVTASVFPAHPQEPGLGQEADG